MQPLRNLAILSERQVRKLLHFASPEAQRYCSVADYFS
jgi:hypothetical protein